MTFIERLNELCSERKISKRTLEKEAGLSNGVTSKWKDVTPGQSSLIKLSNYFGVSVDYLTGQSDIKTPNTTDDANTSTLTRRDHKEINDILSDTKELLRQEGLMFNGNPASPEAIESILSAMEVGMELAKKNNKEKYTPKKYK